MPQLSGVVLALSGDIIDISIGSGITGLMNPTGAIATRVSIEAMLLMFDASTAVRIFFGIYSANRAAGLGPIEALR